MEQLSLTPQRHAEPDNFSLKDWAMKAIISRDNTKSRRYSATNIRSFREETKSFRSTTTISSTVSSPGYTFRDEIDPSTYSFTTALKALQARSGYGWEWLSPDTLSLSSKWNEAEKYICNPLSGEFPMECLSTKALSGRHFGNIKVKTTMSAPLVYSSRPPMIQTRPNRKKQDHEVQSPSEVEESTIEVLTRDVATQSTPPDVSSSSPSPASTPLRENCESPKACPISKIEIEVCPCR
ncbi:hypothetical protein AQUCO_02600229v1 [Aquilegia coerulea]|uniref:Uncharacterized protein n=1 Tax=Aquilegia coerulea TaxID=218851 RepID=A0A2G5D7Z1_AQUCA|nr:hypothetical protein AQUCO_02600229v1 [Aquilegia coerulea]